MVKPKRQFVCNTCGSVTLQWTGQCPSCHVWNTITEEIVSPSRAKVRADTGAMAFQSLVTDEDSPTSARHLTTVQEFDRVCGGGIVPGSVLLLGGDPGIGKSTLLLQVSTKLIQAGKSIAYVSGEEAHDQIRLRAHRMGVEDIDMPLANSTRMVEILSYLEKSPTLDVVVIDSIQTMHHEDLDSAAGSVSQVRHCAQELIRIAKTKNIAIILVGHVTKEGTLAGPRVLEHMVDTVLHFEGDRTHQFRILRGVKNRFGPTDEIGVFSMEAEGLAEVTNPSALFLQERAHDAPGSCVFSGIEGTRPLLVEVQALVQPTTMAVPRRSAVGYDVNRLNMILAVLETHAGYRFSDKEVYLNIVGGLRITEPAADIAIACALISAMVRVPLPSSVVMFGEIGLTGEIRRVSQAEKRLKEAQKLGFIKAIVPHKTTMNLKGISLHGLSNVGALRQVLAPSD
ncbi:MAG: DNA repair protein RadA [Alphaproteobacteria bacterium]|nr:MAG: DNA repair protein RadA [Alphaproteobacteria bacterium]